MIRLFLFVLSFALAMSANAQAPTDQQLTAARLKSLSADLEYAQMLLAKLSAELKETESRAKWAVDKLWGLDDDKH